MSNNNFWLDTLNNNLLKAYNFFKPKHWTQQHNEIWANALCYEKHEAITEAFNKYYEVGSHMPKPAEIKKLIREIHPVKLPALVERKVEELPQCDKIIHAAWIKFNVLQNDFEFPFRSEVHVTDDQAVLICNMEAKRTNSPHAIEKMFWLTDVWGCLKVEQTDEEIMEILQRPRVDHGQAPNYQQYLTQ